MKLSFDLEIYSPEAIIGLCVTLVALIILALLWSRRADVARNKIRIKGSKGANVNINQSRRTEVNVNTNVTLNNHAPAPTKPPRPRGAPSRTNPAGQDDAMVIVVAILGVTAVVGFHYLRNFEFIAVLTRTLCFAMLAYSLLGSVLDAHWRGLRLDEIQIGYLLAGAASLLSAGFLVQAQSLVSSDMIQAAAVQGQGAMDFFLNRLTNAGRLFLLGSLVATIMTSFVTVAALLSVIRALTQSWYEEDERPWFARLILGTTHWVAPVPFLLMASAALGFTAFLLYWWLPNAL